MPQTPFLTLFSFATCGKIQSINKNELSKRAARSDIALSSNVSFIPILFFPKFPTWKVEGSREREDINAVFLKYKHKSIYIQNVSRRYVHVGGSLQNGFGKQ